MKIVRVYKKANGAPWFSPLSYFKALISGEPIKLILHGMIENIVLPSVETLLEKLFKARLLASIGVILTGISLALVIRWSIIQWLPEIEGILIFFFLLSGVLGLVNALGAIKSLRLLRKHTKERPEVVTETGLTLSPPVQAYREVKVPKVRLIFPVLLFLFSILLNSVVFASYRTPAVINDTYVVHKITLVEPWTKWEQRPRYIEDFDLVYFTMDGDSALWTIRAEYTIERSDPYQDIQEGRDWIPNVLNYFVDSISSQVQAGIPAGMTEKESMEYFVESMAQEAVINDLETALIGWFSQRYDKINISQVSVTVERMKVSEYQKYLRTRQ
jgi:hypothetical protein